MREYSRSRFKSAIGQNSLTSVHQQTVEAMSTRPTPTISRPSREVHRISQGAPTTTRTLLSLTHSKSRSLPPILPISHAPSQPSRRSSNSPVLAKLLRSRPIIVSPPSTPPPISFITSFPSGSHQASNHGTYDPDMDEISLPEMFGLSDLGKTRPQEGNGASRQDTEIS